MAVADALARSFPHQRLCAHTQRTYLVHALRIAACPNAPCAAATGCTPAERRKLRATVVAAAVDKLIELDAAIAPEDVPDVESDDEADDAEAGDEAADADGRGAGEASVWTVEIGGRRYDVAFDGDRATVNGRPVDYSIREAVDSQASPSRTGGEVVAAELAGQVLRVSVKEGDEVAEGELLLMLEALKMEIEVNAPRAGTVSDVQVSASQTVNPGDVLVTLS